MIVEITVCAHCFKELAVVEEALVDCVDHPSGEKTTMSITVPDPDESNPEDGNAN